MTIIELTRKSNENEREYIWRLASAKDAGTLDMTWDELTEIFNRELRDEDETFNSSAYRKPFQQAKAFYEDVFSKMVDSQYSDEILVQKDELYKVKAQVRDQRREYNKLLVSDARADHLSEELIEIAKQLNKEKPLSFDKYVTNYSDNEAVIVFADWHYGMVTDNIFNTYNTEICRQRVKSLVEKATAHIELHKPTKLHVLLLGDSSHGAIHTGCRVASEEDTCDQLMHVAEIMAEAISELGNNVKKTLVYSTYGNHMRTIQDKKDSVHSDNMEKIVPWWLKERLQKRDDIEIVYADFKEFLKLNVLGYNICCVHGDLDNIKNLGVTVNTIFTKLFGETIDYTISADKHHLEEFESFGIESMLVRSLCGTDDYANEHRLYSKAGQSFFIFTKDEGRQCTYNIKLN